MISTWRTIGIALSVTCSLLQAGIIDHLKPASGKDPISKMRNVDFIYTINLDQRPEKFAKCVAQLHPYGISPYRFSAVNGWELTEEDINDVGLVFQQGMDGGFMGTSYLPNTEGPTHGLIENEGQVYFCHCMSRGAIGIVLSHLSVLLDAWRSGYDTIWVMEDDIEVLQDPRKISDLIDELDARLGRRGWDVLFTDQDIRDANGQYVPSYGMARRPNFHPTSVDKYIKREMLGEKFMLTGSRFGAHSMIIRRNGIKKIINFILTHQIFFPYDMDYYLPENIRMYSLIEDIVSNQPKALSDNGGPNYLKKPS